MVLLGDEAQVEAQFNPFGDVVIFDARYVHGLHRAYYRLENHFGRTGWYYYVMWVRWNLVSERLETVFVSVQDRCTVCAKHIIGSEIVLHALRGTPW
jgi:hypothetical protein